MAEIAIDENVPTKIPEKSAIEKPANDSPAKIHIANIVARVVPEVIKVRTMVDLIARLIIDSILLDLFLFMISRILSPTIIESFSE